MTESPAAATKADLPPVSKLLEEISRVTIGGKISAALRQKAVLAAGARLLADAGITPDNADANGHLQAIVDAGQEAALLRELSIRLAWEDKAGLSKEARALGCKNEAFFTALRQAPEALNTPEEWGLAIQRLRESLLAGQSASAGDGTFQFCHFRAKLTNSKAVGDVFVSTQRKSRLPYLFSASLQTQDVLPPDKLSTTAPKAVIEGLSGAIELSAEVKQALERQLEAHPVGEQGLDCIDARLRQIVLPRDGSYLGLIPLSSSCIAHVVEQRISALFGADEKQSEAEKLEAKAARARYQFPDRLANGVGGGKSQNVTSYHAITTSRYFPLNYPVSDELRAGFGIVYKGYRLKKFHTRVLRPYAKAIGSGGVWRDDRDTLMARDFARKNGLADISRAVMADVRRAMFACEAAREALGRASERDQTPNLETRDAATQAVITGRMTASAAEHIAGQASALMQAHEDAQRTRLFAMEVPLMSLIEGVIAEDLLRHFGSHA